MGRPPSNGGPAFRFNNAEVAEMEAILQAHNATMPAREMIETLAQKFSTSPERSGKFVVQMKQVWNWFQNRRYAIRARNAKFPGNQNVAPLPRDDSEMAKNVAQAPQPQVAPLVTRRNLPQAPQHLPAPAAVNGAGKNVADSTMEFEAKSARDGAWYDVASFISHRNLETGDPEVLVRFAGFGAEEDEWINICRHVRQRSLPCESSECVAVLPGDLILCFQEGKEQALYFDAHVLDSQRRRHDIRGCRCRFLVRYDHDQSEEIVPLRKVCRRPETDHRLQSLHALSDSATPKQPKAVVEHRISTLRVYPPPEVTETQLKKEEHANVIPMVPATSDSNLSADGTKNQPAKDYEIADAATVENSNAPPGSGFQLPENPEVMNAVIQKDSSATPGNDDVIHENAVDDAATNMQGELNMTTEHNAVDEAATNIQGELNMTTEHDAVNEVPVNATATNIQGELNMTTEHDAVDEAATNIQGEMNMAVENDAVKEVPTDIQGGQNETVEKDVVSNDNATNIEGDSNGMLEYEAVTSTSTIAEQ